MSDYDERTDLASAETSPHTESTEQPGSAAVGGLSADWATGDGWEAPTTGVAAVDEVLGAVQALDGRPVEEHVAVFEQAHERLRRALDPGHG